MLVTKPITVFLSCHTGNAIITERVREACLAGTSFSFVGCSPLREAVESTRQLVPDYAWLHTLASLGPHPEDPSDLFVPPEHSIPCNLAAAVYDKDPDLFGMRARNAIFEITPLIKASKPGASIFLNVSPYLAEMMLSACRGQPRPDLDLEPGQIAKISFSRKGEYIEVVRLAVPSE
ncbi:MAG: hypothetical protein V4480_03190 [Patescibacteria group bacterium]